METIARGVINRRKIRFDIKPTKVLCVSLAMRGEERFGLNVSSVLAAMEREMGMRIEIWRSLKEPLACCRFLPEGSFVLLQG